MKSFEETWYRGTGALRLGGKIYREEWGIWLEMAKALPHIGNKALQNGNRYDWDNKLAFRLSRDDLGKLGSAFERAQVGDLLNLVHRHRQHNKTIKVVLAKNGNYFINGFKDSLKISIPLEPDAVWRFRICLRLAYEESLWNENVFVKQST